MIWIWNGVESTSDYFLLYRHFFYLLRNLLSWRRVTLHMTNSYQVSQCNWSRTTGGRYYRRGSVNLNCQFEEDFVENWRMAGKREGLAHSKGHIFKAQVFLIMEFIPLYFNKWSCSQTIIRWIKISKTNIVPRQSWSQRSVNTVANLFGVGARLVKNILV